MFTFPCPMQEVLSPIAFPTSMNIMPASLSSANLSVMTFLNLNSLYKPLDHIPHWIVSLRQATPSQGGSSASLDVSGVPGAPPASLGDGVSKVESGGERVCKKAKACTPVTSQTPNIADAVPPAKPPVTARKSQPTKPEPPKQSHQPPSPSPSPTLHYSPKPSMPPPPPPLVLKAEAPLRRMPPRPSSALVTPIARPPVKLAKAELGTKDDGSVVPSSKTEIPSQVAPNKRAVITPSRATPSKPLKVDGTQHDEHDGGSETSTVPGELEVAPTQVDQLTQPTTELEQPKTPLEPTPPVAPPVATPVQTPAQPTPPVEPPVSTTAKPTPPVPPRKVDVAQPKQVPQPNQVPQPKHTPLPKPAPQPKQAAAAVRPQQQADVDQQFQVQNNDGTAIQPASPKERQQHYAAFKRQVTGEITSITVPHEFAEAWKDAVASKSRTAKNKLFSMWCSAGGSWSKIFGLNYQKQSIKTLRVFYHELH